jgi:hypothetical protein
MASETSSKLNLSRKGADRSMEEINRKRIQIDSHRDHAEVEEANLRSQS